MQLVLEPDATQFNEQEYSFCQACLQPDEELEPGGLARAALKEACQDARVRLLV